MARSHVDPQALVILVVYGTTGELIKLAPVLTRLRERGHAYLSATTAQQVEQIPPLLQQLELPAPDLWLGRGARGRDLRTNSDVPRWLATVITRFVRHGRGLRHGLRAGPGKPLVLVHGDTMTTVLGASMGRMLRTGVAHIEGGLRSYDWRNPFPEELNRRAASKLARIHYAPGSWAASNLEGRYDRRHRLEHDPGQPADGARRLRAAGRRPATSRTESSASIATSCWMTVTSSPARSRC